MVYHDKNSLGQNFIKFPRLIKELIVEADIQKEDTILEIGPGKGIITFELAKRSGKVIAVEKDENLVTELKQKFQNLANISIIHQDFLEFELPKFPYVVFANIPFSLTSEIINKLVQSKNNPHKIFLIMQLEAGEKYTGEKGETMSSILIKPWYDVEILGDIDRTNFTQKPQVKIVFVRFVLRPNPFIKDEDKVAFRDFVTYGFSVWAPTFSEAFKKIFTYPQIKTLEKMYKIAGKKPSQVSFDDWLLIFKTYRRIGNEDGKRIIKQFLKDKDLK